jgi:serine protease Do
MRSRILVSGICTAGFLAGALSAAPPGETPHAHAASTRIVVSRGNSYLGVAYVEIVADRAKQLHLKEERGVEVTCVDEASPAAKAGLKPGDVVLEYNGERVEGGEHFIRLVRETPPGRIAKLSIWRNGANQTLTATIGQRQPGIAAFSLNDDMLALSPPPMPEIPTMPTIRIPDIPRALMSWRSPVLGIESESLNPQLAEFFGVKEGVLVRAVGANSVAEKTGFKAGDVIIKVDGEKVVSPKEISGILESARAKKTLPITVVRHQKEIVLNVTLEENSRLPAMGTPELLGKGQG